MSSTSSPYSRPTTRRQPPGRRPGPYTPAPSSDSGYGTEESANKTYKPNSRFFNSSRDLHPLVKRSTIILAKLIFRRDGRVLPLATLLTQDTQRAVWCALINVYGYTITLATPDARQYIAHRLREIGSNLSFLHAEGTFCRWLQRAGDCLYENGKGPNSELHTDKYEAYLKYFYHDFIRHMRTRAFMTSGPTLELDPAGTLDAQDEYLYIVDGWYPHEF
ncbi:hypothetical protein P7C70_g6841, partial [Phenoliferia sp. Uapishka_3]